MEPRSRIRLIAAGTIGNVLEWYDFAIYGYFAVSIGRNFFPSGDPVAQVLAAFGVFAVIAFTAVLTFRETNPRGSR